MNEEICEGEEEHASQAVTDGDHMTIVRVYCEWRTVHLFILFIKLFLFAKFIIFFIIKKKSTFLVEKYFF